MLPTFTQPPTTLTFLTSSTLVLAFAGSNSVATYHLDQRRLGELKTRVSYTDERVVGLLPLPSIETGSGVGRLGKCLAWGSNWLSVVEIPDEFSTMGSAGALANANSTDLATTAAKSTKGGKKRRKSRPAGPTSDNPTVAAAADEPFKMIARYRDIGTVGFLASDEVLLVERPFTDLIGLPPAFVKPKYNS